MPRQQVEFEFPDPDKEAVAAAEIEVALDEEDAPLEVEGAVGREYMKKPGNVIKAGDVEIEVEDDTPPGDRGKTPSDFKEASDEELERYSNNVKKRMKQLNKLIHDERRAKEAAFLEREELERFARPLIQEN